MYINAKRIKIGRINISSGARAHLRPKEPACKKVRLAQQLLALLCQSCKRLRAGCLFYEGADASEAPERSTGDLRAYGG